MAKRIRNATENSNRRKGNERRGTGRLADYTPWLKIQDVASQSVATRIKGWKTGRIHHILSQSDLNYFYLLEWSPQVIDIREQFPLDQNETVATAESIGVKHPADSVSKENIVITTSFSVTVRSGFGTKELARTVAHSKSLFNRRTIEILEIERRYWKFRNIDWGIVTERDLNSVVIENICWVHSSIDPADLAPITEEQTNQAENFMVSAFTNSKLPLREITNACDKKLGLPTGGSLSIVRHLIANRRLKVDMKEAIQPAKPLILINKEG